MSLQGGTAGSWTAALMSLQWLDSAAQRRVNLLTARFRKLDVREISVRASSLDFITEQLPHLHNLLFRPSSQGADGWAQPSASRLQLATLEGDVFPKARQLLHDLSTSMCELLATKLVFVELRPAFLQSVYVPDSRASDIRVVLRELNVGLGAIVRCLPRRHLREVAVTAIFRSCTLAYEMVLLHGGPRRTFSCGDAHVISRDLELLQDFFLAQDARGVAQGVPWSIVTETTHTLHHIAALMACPSAELITLWESSESTAHAANLDETLHRSIIAQVLLHRNDNEAKSWSAKHSK